MGNLSTWSQSAGGNTSPSPNGAPEAMPPSGVNDTMREMMAATRRWYEEAEWVDLGITPAYATTASFTLAGDRRTAYHTGRRLRASDATILYGKISDVTYSANTRVSVTLDSGQLSSSLTAVAVGILSFTNQSIPEISATASFARSASSAGAISDGTNFIHTKIINIGDWNMDSTAVLGVAHGLTYSKIRGVAAMIRNDADTELHPLTLGIFADTTTIPGSVYDVDSTNVNLRRASAGEYDNTAYDSTSYSRGWITITYVE